MFGDRKKNAPLKPDAITDGLGEGELILEQLFTDEPSPPASPASKVHMEAEDAEFIEIPRDAESGSSESIEGKKAGKRRAKRKKQARTGGLAALLGKSASADPAQPEPAHVAPAEADGSSGTATQSPISEDVEGGLTLDLTDQANAEADEPAEPPEPTDAKGKSRKGRRRKAPQKKQARSRPSRRRAEHPLYIAAKIAEDRHVYWKLTRDGVSSVDALPDNARAVSFSSDDLRFETDRRLGHSAALALILQEIGDAVQILNRSRELGAVYATLRERLDGLHYRIGPGSLLLDRLARERAPGAEALIVGVELKDTDGRDALLVLYYLSATGSSSEPQISVYPDNRDFILSQFAATHQANRENTQVLLLDHAALLDAAAKLELYPNEENFAGIALRKIWLNAAAASVVAAAVAVGWAYQVNTQLDQTRGQVSRAQASAEMAERAATELLSTSPRALIRGLSLDVEAILTRSRAFWVQSARVQLTADDSGSEYIVNIPLLPSTSAVAAQVNTRAVDGLLHLQTPEGCESSPLNFSGTFNEVQLYIRCEAPAHPLDRYRSR